MPAFRFMPALAALFATLAIGTAAAQDIGLQPKYGQATKTEAQQAADARFLAAVDEQYKGDRKKAAGELAQRGWDALRLANPPEAMRRFNQAWLLDAANGHALWGMAAAQAELGQPAAALKLFREAERTLPGDIDFAADHARTLGFVAVQSRDEALLQDAFARFARVQQQAPQHTLNLQNWAITLFQVGRYADAWAKVKLAEATPRRGDLDPRFIADLQARMPRP